MALVCADKLHLDNFNQAHGFMDDILNSKWNEPQNKEYTSYIIDQLTAK